MNEGEKERIFQEVIGQQGPPDGTVIVSLPGEEIDDDMVDEIVNMFSDVGEIILVR